MLEITSRSIFAKILAKETLILKVSAKAKTASIDLRKRVLTLPDWDVSEELDSLLISHEISHALYTPEKDWTDFIQSFPDNQQAYAGSILNIVEDARIEKMIIRKYPGLKRSYIKGYEELVNVFGWFGSKMKPNFINRINYYFKAVVSGNQKSKFPFDAFEQSYLDRIAKLEDFSDVMSMTRELIEKYPLEEVDYQSTVFGGNLDAELDSEDIEEIIKEKIDGPPPPPPPDKEDVHREQFSFNTTDYRTYVTKSRPKPEFDTQYSIPIDNSILKYMSIEFKKRLNAKRWKETKNLRSGELDTKKLFSYKYNQNLFVSKRITPKQKNHGVILLVDGSSSMQNSMPYVSKQAYNIARFCKNEDIPCRTFVFSGDGGKVIRSTSRMKPVRLIEFFDRKETMASDVNLMARMAMGGTPLTAAILALISLVEEMKNSGIDVVNFMVITDGGCDESYMKYGTYHFQKSNTYIKADVGFRGYEDSTVAFYKVLRDFYQTNVLTFDIGGYDCYNSYHNTYGVDRHFEIPFELLSDPVESRRFLSELMESMAQ